MKRLLLPILAGALVALGPLATAAEHGGAIFLGAPAFGLGLGPTEFLHPCDEAAQTTNLDAVWFAIAGEGTGFTLVMDLTLDADVYFYDADCGYLDTTQGAQGFLGDTEEGPVPPGAAFAIVVGYAGSGSFVLTIA